MELCYTTAFFDIGRDHWSTYSRTVHDYISSFLPLLRMFRNVENRLSNTYRMIVYMDTRHIDEFRRQIPAEFPIRIIPLDEEWLETHSPLWRRLAQEHATMASAAYQIAFASRLSFPENHNPRYTMINHCKVDFVAHAMTLDRASHFCWVDFGYCKSPAVIPERPIDIERLNTDTIHYTLIRPLDAMDQNVLHTMVFAPERFGGFWFGGSRSAIARYQTLYHATHQQMLRLGLVDDDQHLALRCYDTQPELFTLHVLGRWHMALVFFQLPA